MAYETIKTENDNGVLIVTLNRPDRMNAFNVQMHYDLVDVFTKVNEDDDVKVVVVTGAGDRAFCAGADLEAGGDTFNAKSKSGKTEPIDWSMEKTDPRIRDTGGKVSLSIYNCMKPVIGAINGAAVGIGATMQLPMDIRIASDNARFGFVFSRRGIVPEAASSWFLPRLVGPQQALDWMLSGRVFGAEEALAGRLVHQVVPQDQLMDVVMEKARDIADNCSAISVSMIRAMVWQMLATDHPMEAHIVDSRGVAATGQSADAKEGVMSFLEKRAPNFELKPSKDMPSFYPWWEERDYR